MAQMLLKSWRLLPQRYFGANQVSTAIATDNGLLCFGHSSVNGLSNKAAYIARVSPDGEVMPFKATGALTASRTSTTGLLFGDKVYSFGGLSAPFDVVSAKLSGLDLAAFSQVAALDATAISLSGCCADYSTNFVFFGGGLKSGVYQTKGWVLNPNSNTIVSSFDLPIAMSSFRCAVSNGYLYLFGGQNASTVFSTIWSAKIQNNSGIGQWQVAGSLPVPLARFAMIQKGNRVLLAGGSQSTAAAGSTGVWSIELESGSVKTLVTEEVLPVAVYFAGMATDGENVWFIGGQTGSNVTTQSVSTIYHNRIG